MGHRVRHSSNGGAVKAAAATAAARSSLTAGPPAESEIPAVAIPVPTPVEEQPPAAEFLNRDLQWLEFNARVLHEALDDRTPLLERVRFLGIFTSNLDEFFMKRAATLRRQSARGALSASSADGWAPAEVFAEARKRVRPILVNQAECYASVIRPELARNGIHLLEWDDLTAALRSGSVRSAQFSRCTPCLASAGRISSV